jgi:hypothetical protein
MRTESCPHTASNTEPKGSGNPDHEYDPGCRALCQERFKLIPEAGSGPRLIRASGVAQALWMEPRRLSTLLRLAARADSMGDQLAGRLSMEAWLVDGQSARADSLAPGAGIARHLLLTLNPFVRSGLRPRSVRREVIRRARRHISTMCGKRVLLWQIQEETLQGERAENGCTRRIDDISRPQMITRQ